MKLRAVCVATLFAVLSAAAPAQTFPFIPAPSVWRLDPAASDLGGQPAPRLQELSILAYSGTELRWKLREVDPQGAVTDYSWEGAPDGKLRPVFGQAGENASFTSNTSHFEEPDGTTVDALSSLSADGKVWTQTMMVKTKDGQQLHMTSVLRRVR